MSAEDTAKSIGAAFAFSGVAWLSDTLGLGISTLQSSALSTITAALTPPVVFFTAVAGFAGWVIGKLGGPDVMLWAQSLFGLVFGIQFILSLLTLCVFYAIVLISPRGTYSVLDCLIAGGIFLAESMPILCGFTLWGGFAVYMRRREVSGIAEKVGKVAGLAEKVGGGGVGGVASKALSLLKK